MILWITLQIWISLESYQTSNVWNPQQVMIDDNWWVKTWNRLYCKSRLVVKLILWLEINIWMIFFVTLWHVSIESVFAGYVVQTTMSEVKSFPRILVQNYLSSSRQNNNQGVSLPSFIMRVVVVVVEAVEVYITYESLGWEWYNLPVRIHTTTFSNILTKYFLHSSCFWLVW